MDNYIGKMLDDRYEILEVIGTGGMAVVYKAKCHRLNRLVAVKILKDEYSKDEEFRRRFQAESQAVAMLSHPNIVSVYDVSQSGDTDYIVMELIDGITLKQYMEKKGVLNWRETLHFSIQIAKALEHAHSRGIVHRDIKPHNIMILKNGSVKVADFGIARVSSAQSTLTREALGSVHYISPEQAKGSRVDNRTDLYSLGVVMYEMLTGRLPFEGENAVSIAIQHISSIPLMPREINPDIPVGLETITMKAMNPDLDKRYQFAEQLYEDLETFRKNPDVDFSETDLEFQSDDSGKKEQKKTDARQAPEQPISSVQPVSRRGDMSRAAYRDNSRRARTVSILSGMFLVIVFILGVFLYLWHSWFDNMFSEPETMAVPDFVGQKLEDILANPAYTDYFNIIPAYEASESIAEGKVMNQNPAAKRNVIKSEKKADIKLTVSSGTTVIILPEMVNHDYRDAIIQLNKLGLNHDESFVKSEDVTEGYVISMIPDAGAQMKAGDTVFLEISTGPEIKYVTMPQLVGDTISTAQAKLEGSNLVMGTITERPDDAPAGTVTWQSRSAGESVQEKTKINVIISSGPAETPPPPDENEEVPPEQQGEGQEPDQQGGDQPTQEGDGSVG